MQIVPVPLPPKGETNLSLVQYKELSCSPFQLKTNADIAWHPLKWIANPAAYDSLILRRQR